MGYDNSQRAAAASATRSKVLAAAHASFLEHGFAATTIRQVAEDAGVSQETIYKSFGTKAALLKAVYDVSLAGDDADVPISARPEAIAVREARTPEAAVAAFAEFARLLSGRTDPLVRVMLGSKDTDQALSAFADTIDAERLAGARMHVGHWAELGWIRTDIPVERAAQILWAINANEPRWLLRDQGWTEAEFAGWLAQAVRDAIFA